MALLERPVRILTVCLGNICRSPIAQGLVEHFANLKSIPVEVDSAGLASYHIGEPPHPRSLKVCKERGLDISHQRARAFNTKDYDYFDFILAMDKENLRDLKRFASNEEQLKKIFPVTHWISNGKEIIEVPDPYYGDEEDYEYVYELLEKSIDHFTDFLKNEYIKR
ncbi:MAG: protein-tyrosine-phosphatase [Vicingaceae bacterium]|jgi:protein-tyrosine-phosphatase|nr:MAG: protein-tyrosine-phosphatase [Vicingaceae bacterium]